MRQRCSDPNAYQYHRYGGRGIKVCARWKCFENFLADMGERPSKAHSLDRIDNDKGYSPKNCRWATRKEQGRNCATNRRVTFRGRTLTVIEWSEMTGISQDVLLSRFNNGWSIRRALTARIRKYRKTTPALTSHQVQEIRRRLALGERGTDLAPEFGVTKGTISAIKHHHLFKGLK
jgi:hypothetical protein